MLRIEGSVYQKLGYFLLEFVQTSNLCHGKSIALSTKLVVDGRAC